MKNRLKKEIESALIALAVLTIAGAVAYGLYITEPSECRTLSNAIARYCID